MDNKLGNYIKEKRENINISQRELARRINFDNATISKLENGMIRKPSIELLIKIANELDIPIHELIQKTEYEEFQKFLYLSSIDTLKTKAISKQIDKSIIDKVMFIEYDDAKVDILKVLKEYKQNNINEIDTIKLITMCNPIDLDNQIIYECENENVIIDINEYIIEDIDD